jgi:methionyl-tRNA formyltransferase
MTLRILVAGTPENAAQALRLLADGTHPSWEIAGVLTRDDAPVGRKRVLTPSPAAVAAAELSLPIIKANRVTEDVIEEIRALNADVAFVVAYGALLRTNALEALPLGWFNLHYSLLPDLRGAAPVQRSVMLGRDRVGATLFRIDEGLDTGPIAAVWSTERPALATAGDLLHLLTERGTAMARDFFDRLSADPTAADHGEPQPVGDWAYAHKLTAEDSRLDLTGPAETALLTGLGTLPAPGPWVLFQDSKFKILGLDGVLLDELASKSGSPSGQEIGSVRPTDTGIAIRCADGEILVSRVQPFGKKPMNAADWLRGAVSSSTLTELRFTS